MIDTPTSLREAVGKVMRCQFTHSLDAMFALQTLIEEADRAADEIERLYKDISSVNRRCDHLGMSLRDIKAERDALRTLVERASEWCDYPPLC